MLDTDLYLFSHGLGPLTEKLDFNFQLTLLHLATMELFNNNIGLKNNHQKADGTLFTSDSPKDREEPSDVYSNQKKIKIPAWIGLE